MLEFLKNAAKSGNLAHAYLFHNGDIDEMKNTAFGLAEHLKTDQIDILYIVPEQNKKTISIGQIRSAKKHLILSPYNSFYKFAIINGAEAMTQEASDALLKTLEEPQGNAILILISQIPSLLPKTILSRLQEIRFKSIPLSRVAKDFINQDHINILGKPLHEIFKYIEKIAKDDNADIFPLLNSWLFWLREKLIAKQDFSLIAKIKEINKTKELISNTNVNVRLALENLVLCINNYSTI